MSDVDVFVTRDGFENGYWRDFLPAIPDSMRGVWERSDYDALGCQVKMRTGGIGEPDGDDSLQWSYFVEPDTFDLQDFLDNPRWVPQPVDLFAVVKFDIGNDEVTSRGRLIDKVAVQSHIIESVQERLNAGKRTLAFGSQRFSFEHCLNFPAETCVDISKGINRLLVSVTPN